MWERALASYVIQGGCTLTEYFDVKDKLGQGTFGNVYLAATKNATQSLLTGQSLPLNGDDSQGG